ncbi:AMP-dependent synthetase/ligase domain-containing protein [Caenorhabditis elegans]|uniref:AMP-dependent synthetase/ligase domain-containing protein n=1 Tax=Caenorhabditis elegans TaxID=6239 RepID=Q8I104_CAEEL|nr:AMP-dependent synthetase/ligase domain-containing protein [Caenorhabditis elegans]CAD54160.1 AMP-dependent synthetase/ligase domain-containing protein [Caenorhabditis elegans]|eukprot:NP_871636.1 Uncharacterized protein CELE_W09D6.1 [Caenorhabditis elegans]
MTEINRNLKIIDVGCNATIPAEDIFEKIDNFTEILRNSNCRAITGSDVVFISIERGLDAIVAVIACLRLELVFTFCPPASDTDDVVRKFRTTLVFNGKHVSRIAQNDENGLLAAESICYVIQTSGTTGAKKQVAVPVDCIRKNIEHFCSLFNLTSSDSILFSTSLHFDPSIVELFMAFHVGCTLIITPDEYRSEPHKLQKSIDKFQPTVVQLTPTVFEMLPSADSLLSATSSLRILLLGGSHFPISSINSCRSPENKTRVFNVYGVTEVSCWASYFEVEHGCSEVLIGEAIYGTQLGVDSDGQLILGGPRQCYVDGVKALNHKTGDRVEVTENGGQKIVGRIDRLIKHRGIRICLDHLSHVALRHDPSIQSLHTMLLDNRNIVQFHVGPGSSSPTHKTLRLDATTVVPITVIQVAELPINSSGKVDEKALERIYGKVSGGGNSKFQEIFEQKLKVKLSEVLDVSFVSLGVNSLLAAELSTFFQVSQQTEVMRRMLNETVPVGDVLRKFELSPKLQSHVDFEVRKIIRKRQPKMRWAVDLRKCIDGNLLVICNTLVVCASHAGIVIAVNPQTGNLIWRAECGVRFECKPILVNDQVVLGCKSTGLYFICVKTGQIQNSVILETVGVRAQCAFDGGAIYCTTENGNFHVIDPKTYGSIYSHAISKIPGGTSVGPVIAPDGSIFATITAGAVLRTTVPRKSIIHGIRRRHPFWTNFR